VGRGTELPLALVVLGERAEQAPAAAAPGETEPERRSMSDKRGVTDIPPFAADAIAAYQRCPPLDSESVTQWLGNVRQVVYDEDEAARRELAVKLIALAAHAADIGDEPDGLVEICAQTIAESNKLLAELEGALVSFVEHVLLPDDLVEEVQRMCDALGEDEEMTQIQGVFLAAGVVADPRPRYAGAAEREALGRSLTRELELAGELRYAGGTPFDALGPGEQLRAILVDAEAIADDRQDLFVPSDDTPLHYEWSRIVVVAACLLHSPPLSALDRSGKGDSELHRAAREDPNRAIR
jgi:hypothetical protein